MFKKKQATPAPRNMHTIIGNGSNFNGNLNVEGTLRIDREVKGEITVKNGSVIVGKTGMVKAEIRGKDATIGGEVHGNIFLDGKLELLSTAKIYADIIVAKFTINEGAIFKGRCEMSTDMDDSTENSIAERTAKEEFFTETEENAKDQVS